MYYYSFLEINKVLTKIEIKLYEIFKWFFNNFYDINDEKIAKNLSQKYKK